MNLKSGGKPGSKEVFAGKFSPTEDSMLISWTRAVVRGGEEVVVEARVTLTKQFWWLKNLKIQPRLGQLSFPSLCQSTSLLRPDQRSFSLTRLVNKNIKGPSRRNEYTNTLSTKRRADGRRDPPSTQWRETRSSLTQNWCWPVENRMTVNDLTITLCAAPWQRCSWF